MTQYILKVFISALLIVVVSEISKHSSFLGGLLASLPLVSLFAFVWLWHDTRDSANIAAPSTSIFRLVLPSLVLFLVLPLLLKRGFGFYPALGLAVTAMFVSYGVMLFTLGELGIKL
jgi:hypothetical protein